MLINQLDSLDKFRPYVISEDPEERIFGYETYVKLGESDFVIKLVAVKNDIAGVNALTTIGDKSNLVKRSENRWYSGG